MGVEIFAFSFQSLLPGFADRVLHVGAVGLGTLTFAVGLGNILGTAALATLTEHARRGPLILGVTLVFGVAPIAFAASAQLALSFTLMLVVGTMSVMFDGLQWIPSRRASPTKSEVA